MNFVLIHPFIKFLQIQKMLFFKHIFDLDIIILDEIPRSWVPVISPAI